MAVQAETVYMDEDGIDSIDVNELVKAFKVGRPIIVVDANGNYNFVNRIEPQNCLIVSGGNTYFVAQPK